MGENRIDPYQIVGFLILIACAFWVFYYAPQPAENINDDNQNKIESNDGKVVSELDGPVLQKKDTDLIINEEIFTLENEDIILKISNKGGRIIESILKKYFDQNNEPIKINDNNQNIYIVSDQNPSSFDTSNLFFDNVLTSDSDGTKLKFTHYSSNQANVELTYFLPKSGYLFDFKIKTGNLNHNDIRLKWDLESLRNSRSATYENRYTYLNYKNEDDSVEDLSAYSDDNENGSAKWISYSQHFFNSFIIFNDLKNNIDFNSINLDNEDNETKYLKKFETKIPLVNQSNSQINESFKFYIGPNDYYILNDSYDGISKSIWFGWGIFGWINENIFFPLYYFLSSFFSAGIAIIIMVILTRLVMSPVQYKMYLGQAKMRILKPEISVVSEKYKDDPMKKNQETMKIYNQAGANPLAGCLPALIQLPVFYALFCFFPVAFALRGESFLWADDLSTYDVIAELPFYIPFYGDHVSLFPITAAVAMFFYTKMSGSQQMQPSQPGMPNMKFIMYVIPFTLLIFFNNFASGLSLYYTVSNILTIIIMLTIKNFILDEKKILATIEEKKKQPSSENRFQRRLRKMKEMMDEAEKKQKLKSKK
jgi:YidC/Oxa1 family membrane protein insertase|tara:strand:+ start:42014 stop:43795 length:1782 start_codon:yes stop_codon:yes gene_type:complete